MARNENVIISANPGSGKTEKIAEEVVGKLKEGVNPADILCITFTRKAMGEMQERISGKISGMNLNINTPRIETFHSFALSLLKDKGKYQGTVSERFMRYSILQSMSRRNLMNYGIEVLMEDYPTIINVGKIVNAIKFLKSYGIYPGNVDRPSLLNSIRHVYETEGGVRGYTLEEMEILADKFLYIFNDYEKSKRDGYLDYNDYLIRAIESMEKSFSKYHYVFVDEVQDISEIESRIIRLAGERYFLVGDQKQAIFGFQGGNTRSFDSFLNDSNFSKGSIEGTRRLPEKIRDYCMNFFLKSEPGYSGDEFSHFGSHVKSTDGEVRLIIPEDEKFTEELTAQTVEKMLSEVREGDTIGIISRTNSQADQLSSILDSHEIRHQKISGEGIDGDAGREIYLFLRGLFSNRNEDIIAMLYTPFSGLTLKEAMQLSDRIKFAESPGEMLPDELKFARTEYTRDKQSLKRLFSDYIIPLSLSISSRYFITAKDISNTIDEYFDYLGMENFTSLDDFLLFLLQDNVIDDDIPDYSRVSVLTVHKAKGLQFDHVIYLPKYVRGKERSPVDTVVEMILRQAGYHYGFEEREREESRIDFVALSRAKKSLTLITGRKNIDRYNIPPCSLQSGKIENRVRNEFVSLKSLMEKKKESSEPWLISYIYRKIKSFQNLSFTMMGNLKRGRLEDFVITYILGIRESSSATEFGTKIHSYIENYINMNEKPQNLIDPNELEAWKNFMEYDRTVRQTYNGKWIHSEIRVRKNVKDLIQDARDSVNIDGRIDGVYSYMDGGIEKFVVVDFKTSKKPNSEYSQQLSLYAYLYSLEKSINLNMIESEISYISLRDEKINTGRMQWRNERIPYEIELRSFEEVKNYIETFLSYRMSADALVRDIMEVNARTELFRKFQDELRKEIESQ
ncbi:MAG: ATP-dependent helicase [Candidatus Thermoplasmatota archaeon]|jgi:DNA helicase-2/ATP-dependent DNA helicase PcrA|nr:ATP-dependent helicase [Candidatus Thermoplasmatota archaeon]MCL5790379.1 ATP-dependent helicase [Candidatus Thermoplasmatota archaeon]